MVTNVRSAGTSWARSPEVRTPEVRSSDFAKSTSRTAFEVIRVKASGV